MTDIYTAILALVVFIAWCMTLTAIPTLPVTIGWLTSFLWLCDSWRHITLQFTEDADDPD